MPRFFRLGDAPPEIRSTIHSLLVETGKRRPLSRLEIHLRCMTKPRPWNDIGISPSAWYRRRRKQKQASQAAQMAEAA